MSKIAINRMYNGKYLEEQLGHEVINMYQSDNGQYYLYLSFDGTFDIEKYKHKIEKMLLVRTTPYPNCREVIGIATGLIDVYNGEDESQVSYILKNNIKYGGVFLHELFTDDENKTQEKPKRQYKTYITFQAKKLNYPKKTTYLRFNNGNKQLKNDETTLVIDLNIDASRRGQKQYLDDIAEIDVIFNPENIGYPMEKIKEKTTVNTNFFEICGIDNSELAFSNGFAYVFRKHPDILKSFIKEHLKEKLTQEFTTDNISIIREYKHIDLLVRTASHWIIIENKIHSGINGLKNNKEGEHNQLKRYKKTIEDELEDLKNSGKPLPEVIFILLTPNHNHINLSEDDKDIGYQQVFYSELHKTLDNYNKARLAECPDDYLNEIIHAMEKHTKNFYNELYDITEKRLYRRIKNT